MTAEELYMLIDTLATDIEFSYNGIDGAICPFNREKITVGYGDVVKNYTSVKQALCDHIFNGKCLNDICEQLILY